MCVYPFESAGCFSGWLGSVGYLGVFWARRVASVEVVGDDPPLLFVRWLRGRRWRAGYIYFCLDEVENCLEDMGRSPGEGIAVLVVNRDELPAGLYDRWSRVFVYGVDGGFLQPNGEVVVEVYPPGEVNAELLRSVEGCA